MGRARGQHHAVAAPAVPRRGKWNEETIRAAVMPLVDKLGRWPRKPELKAAGLNGAYIYICQNGGTVAWRERLGVPGEVRIGRPVEWPEERCKAVLSEFVRGRAADDWPTWEELTDEGLHDVAQRIQELYGGLREFAHSRGFKYADEREEWDDARVEAEIKAFVGASGQLPQRPTFKAAGQDNLFQAMDRRGGARAWAQRLGLRYDAPTHGNLGYASTALGTPEDADEAAGWFLGDQMHLSHAVQRNYERTLHALSVLCGAEHAEPAALVSEYAISALFAVAPDSEAFNRGKRWREDAALRVRHVAEWLQAHNLLDDKQTARAAAQAESLAYMPQAPAEQRRAIWAYDAP